jgi:hypothetical protein
MSTSGKKKCTECGDEKVLRAFYCHPTGKDGRTSKCKLCTRAAVKANRELKADVYRAKDREKYANDPERRAYKLAYSAAYQKTARGREARRIAQRVYRAFRKASGAPPFPSERPDAVAERNRRITARRQIDRQQQQVSA